MALWLYLNVCIEGLARNFPLCKKRAELYLVGGFVTLFKDNLFINELEEGRAFLGRAFCFDARRPQGSFFLSIFFVIAYFGFNKALIFIQIINGRMELSPLTDFFFTGIEQSVINLNKRVFIEKIKIRISDLKPRD